MKLGSKRDERKKSVEENKAEPSTLNPSLLSIACVCINEYGRPFPFTSIQKRLTRRSIRNDQMFTSHFVQTVAPIRCQKNSKASLVIFDKDGTLICFHSTWVPWAINVAKKISEAINMNVEKEIYSLLGLHEKEQKVKSGLLAEGTMAQIRDAIARLLINRGIEATDAVKVFVSCNSKFRFGYFFC
ncbi:unnamed protein product [Brugia timori]|uniref:Uncharacterized protein n=1 Tax=Brugia timori TaxID=42155 RepID=A0A3P7U1H0_9BILA|nr:unnamed protein product [Brugia timori]